MKSILFLHSSLSPAGAEMMRLTLLRNIDREKFNIKVCCIGEKAALGREIEGLGYVVDELRQDPKPSSVVTIYKLVKYLKKERPDILHSSLFNANFHARFTSLFCRIPHIITEEHGEHKEYKKIRFAPYIISDFLLSRLNDFIICCSDRLREDIIEKERLPRRKTVVIENCLDTSIYKVKIEREAIRKKYNISNELVFILVATLKSGKGHEYLMEVFREIKDMGKYSFKCFFAGDGPLKEALQKRCFEVRLSDEVIFLGNVGNIADYLNASDVFVLPSFSEGLSIALMEGMLMGLASIVTDVGSNSDLIKTGFNGIVVSSGDKEELKSAIIFYLQNKNLINKFGERSKSIVETRYSSIREYVRKHYELWDRCLTDKR